MIEGREKGAKWRERSGKEEGKVSGWWRREIGEGKDWSTRFWHHFYPFFPMCVAPPERGAKNHGFWHLASFLGRLWHLNSNFEFGGEIFM